MKTLKTFMIFNFFSFILFNSCTVTNNYSLSSTTIDLTKFENQGIFITTGDLYKKYKSISIIVVDCYEGYVPKSNSQIIKEKKEFNQNYKNVDDIYKSTPTLESNYKQCYIEDLFPELILKAKQVGANGIIKLEIKNISKSTQTGIEIVGLAVKIE